MDYLLIALMWAAYCALHSFLISIRFTSLMKRLLKAYYAFYRLFYNIISVVLLIPLIIYSIQTEGEAIISYSLPFTIIRYVLISISIMIVLKAFFIDYDFLTFLGIRQLFEFGRKKSQEHSNEIKRNGLLGVVRHPMYFGLMIYLWCQTFSLTDVVINSVLTIYIIIGTYLEEKKLVLEFGEPYIKYQREVPMLIPFTKEKG